MGINDLKQLQIMGITQLQQKKCSWNKFQMIPLL